MDHFWHSELAFCIVSHVALGQDDVLLIAIHVHVYVKKIQKNINVESCKLLFSSTAGTTNSLQICCFIFFISLSSRFRRHKNNHKLFVHTPDMTYATIATCLLCLFILLCLHLLPFRIPNENERVLARFSLILNMFKCSHAF